MGIQNLYTIMGEGMHCIHCMHCMLPLRRLDVMALNGLTTVKGSEATIEIHSILESKSTLDGVNNQGGNEKLEMADKGG